MWANYRHSRQKQCIIFAEKTFRYTTCIGPVYSWWRHEMETFSALLVLRVENSPGTGEFPTQRPVTRSFDVFFDLFLTKLLSKQSWSWWFETPLHSLWLHCNVYLIHPRCEAYCCVCSASNLKVSVHILLHVQHPDYSKQSADTWHFHRYWY